MEGHRARSIALRAGSSKGENNLGLDPRRISPSQDLSLDRGVLLLAPKMHGANYQNRTHKG